MKFSKINYNNQIFNTINKY